MWVKLPTIDCILSLTSDVKHLPNTDSKRNNIEKLEKTT